MLLSQDRADQADQGVAAGENPEDVGAAADLPVEPFLWVAGADLPPDRFGERGEGQDVAAGGVQMRGDLGQFFFQGVEDPGELGVDESASGWS